MKWNTEDMIKLMKQSFGDIQIKRVFHKGDFDSTHLAATIPEGSFEFFGERDDQPMYKNRENVVIDRVVICSSSSVAFLKNVIDAFQSLTCPIEARINA
jgi:hypothetical protein